MKVSFLFTGRFQSLAAALACATLWCSVAPTSAVTLGQIDTFSTDLMGWNGGGAGGGSPIHRSTGGPTGAGDGYIEIEARDRPLGAKNETQWSGDYLSENINAIELDFNNFGNELLELRLVIFGFSELIAYTSADAVLVTPNSGWQHLTFEINDSTMVQNLGNPALDLDFTLSTGTRLLLRHDPGPPDIVGQNIDGNLGTAGTPYLSGIDNVEAVNVPEPGVVVSLLLGGVMALLRRRR